MNLTQGSGKRWDWLLWLARGAVIFGVLTVLNAVWPLHMDALGVGRAALYLVIGVAVAALFDVAIGYCRR